MSDAAPADSTPSTRGTRRRWDASIVFVVAVIVFGVSPVMTSYDSRWVLPTAISLGRHGDANLDEYRPTIEREKEYGIVRRGEHDYNYFPLATSLLVAPAVFPLDRGLQVVGVDLEQYVRDRRDTGTEQRTLRLIEHLLASLVTAAAAALIFLVARERLARVEAFALTAVVAFGTSMFSVASRALWSHGPAMAFLALATLLLLRAGRRPELAGRASVPMIAAVALRPALSVVVAIFAVYVAVQWRSQLWRFLLYAATAGVLFLVANRIFVGAWVPPYFDGARAGSNHDLVEAIVANAISPSRGLLVFSPVLALSAIGLWFSLRKRDWIAIPCAAGILAHWIAVSSFVQWWGGASYGPRLTSDVIPLYAVLLCPVVGLIGAHMRDGRRPRFAVAVLVLAVASVAINFRGAVDGRVWRWNATPVSIDAKPDRVWDWSDPQFLRGLGWWHEP